MNEKEILTPDINIKINELTGYVKEKGKYLSAIKKAESKANIALRTATNAAKENTKIWNVDTTIKHLQQSSLDLAKAIIGQSEAQKNAFENQRKISEIVRFLFSISVHDLASHKKVVNDLKNHINKLSEDPDDQLVKEELMRVIEQFNSQKSVIQRLDDQANRIKELEKRIMIIEKNLN